MRWPARIALGVLALPIGAELLLQGAAQFVNDRSASVAVGRATILCVGDSHTYGAGLSPARAYPGRLQARLDEAAPGYFRVINRGVPGYNTHQVLSRLPDQALSHEAAMILVWVGINDFWNRTEAADAASDWRLRLDALASHSRFYRLVRVRAHDRRIDRALDAAGSGERPLLTPLGRDRWQLEIGGEVERFETQRAELEVDDVTIEHATRNYRAMAHWAESAGIPLAFLTYPVPLAGFGAINGAIDRAASETGAPVISTRDSIARVPAQRRHLIRHAHPNGSMYREIARDVARVVLGSVPPDEGG